MRWRGRELRRVNKFEWHLWFAWYPVKTKQKWWVWLERLARRVVYSGEGTSNLPTFYWEYSLVAERPHPEESRVEDEPHRRDWSAEREAGRKVFGVTSPSSIGGDG